MGWSRLCTNWFSRSKSQKLLRQKQSTIHVHRPKGFAIQDLKKSLFIQVRRKQQQEIVTAIVTYNETENVGLLPEKNNSKRRRNHPVGNFCWKKKSSKAYSKWTLWEYLAVRYYKTGLLEGWSRWHRTRHRTFSQTHRPVNSHITHPLSGCTTLSAWPTIRSLNSTRTDLIINNNETKTKSPR